MENFRAGNFEVIEFKKIKETKENLYFQVHDLYFQRLLSYSEAYQLLREITQAQTAEVLKTVIEDGLFSAARELHQLDYEDEQTKELDTLALELDLLKTNISKENWKELVGPFLIKCCGQKISTNFHFLLRGFSTQALEAALFCYKDNPEDIVNFRTDLAALLEDVSFEDVSFFAGKRLGEKEIAPFFESIQETTNRYESILHFRKIFSVVADDVIIGGSMSYGPFYSVRGSDLEGGSPSDIDGILVFNENIFERIDQLKSVKESLISEEDIMTFVSRVKDFKTLKELGKADIISQKFHFVNRDYNISIHCFFSDDLEGILGSQFENDLSSGDTVVKSMSDFKQKPFEHPICRQSNSSQDHYDYVVPPQEEVKGGFIAQVPAYIVSNDRLYPGLYQNLISPEFNATNQLKSQRVVSLVESFHRVFLGQMEKEKELYGGGDFAKSHIRSALFAPLKYL